MAASCIGSFGAFKWSRYRRDMPSYSDYNYGFNNNNNSNDNFLNETVWVTKRYIPTDLRVTAPVPRHKPLSADIRQLPAPEPHWVPLGEPSPRLFSREHEETRVHSSQPSTRCEEWSTLRQMLPSRGRPFRIRPENWGTGYADPPSMTQDTQRRFPHINSPMTRYVDDMHLTNRLFKLQ